MPDAAPRSSHCFPDVRRPDVGTILVGPWLVRSPSQQRPAADSVMDEWQHRDRPDALLSLTTFLSHDGSHVLNYAQWTSDAEHHSWLSTRRQALVGRIDEAFPDIQRPGPVRYMLYGSYSPKETAEREPGVVTAPTFTTDGPEAQRALADAALDWLERRRPTGLIAAHLHLAKDGTKVLNYMEWARASDQRSLTTDSAFGAFRYRPHKILVNVPSP